MLWLPSMRRFVMTVFQQSLVKSPGEGAPLASLHRDSVWVSRGEAEGELHTQGDQVGEE